MQDVIVYSVDAILNLFDSILEHFIAPPSNQDQEINVFETATIQTNRVRSNHLIRSQVSDIFEH